MPVAFWLWALHRSDTVFSGLLTMQGGKTTMKNEEHTKKTMCIGKAIRIMLAYNGPE